MTQELDLIRRLVEQLSEIERNMPHGMHDDNSTRYGEKVEEWRPDPCSCALCTARQYLSWRESPAVEDPASDAVEFEKIMP